MAIQTAAQTGGDNNPSKKWAGERSTFTFIGRYEYPRHSAIPPSESSPAASLKNPRLALSHIRLGITTPAA